MKVTDSFIGELRSVMDSHFAQLKLAAILAKYSGQTIYIRTGSKRDRRVRAVANMLANGMSPGDAAAAIVQRFGVSKRTAERDVTRSRNLSKKFDVSSS